MRILLEVHQAIHLDNSEIVVQIPCVEIRMIFDLQNIHFNVWIKLAVIMDIPLPQPDSQLLRSELVDAVRCCKEVGAIYECGATGVHIVILVLL